MENFTFHYDDQTVTLPWTDEVPPYKKAEKMLWGKPNLKDGFWMDTGARESRFIEMKFCD